MLTQRVTNSSWQLVLTLNRALSSLPGWLQAPSCKSAADSTGDQDTALGSAGCRQSTYRDAIPCSAATPWQGNTAFGSWCLPVRHYGKAPHKGRAGDREHAKHHKQKYHPDPEHMEFSIEPFEQLMSAALTHFQGELGNLRAGRASPGLLEPVMVAAHDEHLPLKTYGTVTVRNPQLLVVAVYNQQDLETVATAIRTSPLALQARVEGKEVFVPVPRLTVEMLERMAKLLRQEAERARVSVRHARAKALDAARKAFSSEDELQRMGREVQRMHDKYIADIDRLASLKEKDLRENH